MKLITTSHELEKQFMRLIKKYSNLYWATAWASSGSKIFKELRINKDKIKKLVVGTHFYQTKPNFIAEFLDNEDVHFVEQPDGTFHPKIYLFTNGENDWELVVGSANFTAAAFSKNTEANILICSEESAGSNIYQDTLKIILDSFSKGKVFSKKDLDKYTTIWKIHASKIDRLSGNYGDNKLTVPAMVASSLMTMDWATFFDNVSKDSKLEGRLAVLKKANELFNKERSFKDLNIEEQKFIAGIPNMIKKTEGIDCGHFGSMKRVTELITRLKDGDLNISNALDQIPLVGTITKKHYDDYILHFSKVFKNGIAVASRLLCMKRPDVFMCVDVPNKSNFCNALGLGNSELDYEKYWNLIILRVFDCNWWNNPSQSGIIEEQVSNARAAFIDSIFYTPLK